MFALMLIILYFAYKDKKDCHITYVYKYTRYTYQRRCLAQNVLFFADHYYNYE